MAGLKLMRRLVAFDTQCVKQLSNFWIGLDIALQFIDQIDLGCVAVESDARARRKVLRQRFTQLAQFDQRGVGVAGKNLFGSGAELRE